MEKLYLIPHDPTINLTYSLQVRPVQFLMYPPVACTVLVISIAISRADLYKVLMYCLEPQWYCTARQSE